MLQAPIGRLMGAGVQVAALIGRPDQALKQKAAGVDIIIASGTEAGGHTGEISTMVLLPQVVDAVAPTPVLAAGGIAAGRQMAAAMAMGAQVMMATPSSPFSYRMRSLMLSPSR